MLSSTPGNAKPIFRTVSKLIVLLGMGAIIRKNKNLFKTRYRSFAYSAFACFRMGMSERRGLSITNVLFRIESG